MTRCPDGQRTALDAFSDGYRAAIADVYAAFEDDMTNRVADAWHDSEARNRVMPREDQKYLEIESRLEALEAKQPK